ncbi:Detected protein of unknown function [Hibiscus syriacus]|uniref:Uncharacterized protein n=1 Tax=Hibiscus syriacus TaxID=106335 RepID=A0A6A3CJL9_HIBSY|nr:Detected protein of unknown function [Hibiscus syriacus]
MLSLMLIGKRLPVDVMGMVSSILQIVIAPITAGLLLNWRPFLPLLSELDTACSVGALVAVNINSVLSPFGLTHLFLIVAFHFQHSLPVISSMVRCESLAKKSIL